MATPAQEKAAVRLLTLARAGLGNLKPAEATLVRSAATGEGADIGPGDPLLFDTDNVDAYWGPEREVRAEVIRWLCVDPKAKKLVDPNGIQLSGARIIGELN